MGSHTSVYLSPTFGSRDSGAEVFTGCNMPRTYYTAPVSFIAASMTAPIVEAVIKPAAISHVSCNPTKDIASSAEPHT